MDTKLSDIEATLWKPLFHNERGVLFMTLFLMDTDRVYRHQTFQIDPEDVEITPVVCGWDEGRTPQQTLRSIQRNEE